MVTKMSPNEVRRARQLGAKAPTGRSWRPFYTSNHTHFIWIPLYFTLLTVPYHFFLLGVPFSASFF
jgi:hypothetical protein